MSRTPGYVPRMVGDPRRLDDNLDGTAGNGAAVDMGADEWRKEERATGQNE